ncbi:hypothetical protein GCM10009601_23760 [Streptomyces thermospinosisporus]|uniref:SDR family oxidoreductase n=1 Tax=Streptomyces thermospinosisporus TaxID=161482 RepID=A0ABN1YTP6_9ACTN
MSDCSAGRGDISPADVDRVLAVNVRGVFLTSRAAAACMDRGARIITVGGCLALRVPGPGATLYAMTKSALVGLTKALVRELGPRGITANIVHPGPVDTAMNPADGPFAGAQASLTVLGRFGRPTRWRRRSPAWRRPRTSPARSSRWTAATRPESGAGRRRHRLRAASAVAARSLTGGRRLSQGW